MTGHGQMAEPRPDGLSYGHLGVPVYDPNQGQWSFARQIKTGYNLNPIGAHVTSIPPPAVFQREQHKHRSSRSLRQQSRTVAKEYPEVTSSLAILPSFARSSHHITSLTATHDPLISDRLAFGKAESESARKNILAVTAGKAGDLVRLVRVKQTQHSWTPDRDVSLAVPEIDTTEEGWWSADGTPIQQICCADGSIPWMAVRLIHSTVIFRPRYARPSVATPAARGVSGVSSHSRLDANPVASLSLHRTGGVPPADVSFNPWHQGQIAVVDQHGTWSVWDLIDQGSNSKTCAIETVAMGHIYDGHETEIPPRTIDDGWGAISFARTASTLVVCSRKFMAIFDISISSKVDRLGIRGLDLTRNSDWILDLRNSSRSHNHIFVVTSSQVLCLHIGGPGQDYTQQTPSILRCWYHFREGDDTSLRLHVSERDLDFTILLYSRKNSLVTIFNLSVSPLSPNYAVMAFDPVAISLPSAGAARWVHPTLSCVFLQRVPYRYQEPELLSSSDIESENRIADICFYKLFILLSDLSVRECLYVGGPRMRVDHPAISSLDIPNKPETQRSTTVLVDDRFVVSDNEGSVVDQPGDRDFEGVGMSRKQGGLSAAKTDPSIAQRWTVDSEVLYRLITDPSVKKSMNLSSLTLDGRNSDLPVELVTEILNRKNESGASHVETLAELIGHVPDYTDIDDTSSQLLEILRPVANRDGTGHECQPMELKELSSPAFLGLDVDSQGDLFPLALSLANTYDHLIETWLRPLPSAIPGRIRTARAKTLRRVALILYLARIGVRLRLRSDKPTATKIFQVEFPSGQLELPDRQRDGLESSSAKGKGKLQEVFSSPPQSSQISVDTGFLAANRLEQNDPKIQASRPTPNPSPTRATSSATLPRSENEDPACVRLRQYTTVNSQPPLPAPMSRILSHWIQGTDPAQYDWDSTTRPMGAPSGPEPTQYKVQQKLKARRERLLQHRHGLVAKSHSQSNPEQFGASQPQLFIPGQGSSQLAEKAGPMSQPEPGAYGGRQASTKKAMKQRKARIAGF